MKHIFTFLTIIALVLTFSMTVLATDTGAVQEEIRVGEEERSPESAVGVNSTEGAEYKADESASGTTDGTDENGSSEGTASENGTTDSTDGSGSSESSVSENPFAILYEKIREYSGEIISAVSLLLTALLSLAYKKGLIPVINSGLSAMGGAVSAISENAKRGAERLEGGADELLKTAKLVEGALFSLNERLSDIERELSAVERIERSENTLRKTLDCQLESLAEIYVSAAFPEYKKVAFCKKISDMREELTDVCEKTE